MSLLASTARAVGCGAADQPALAKGHAEVTQHAQFLGVFDAFGHQLGAKGFGQLQQGAEGLQLLGMGRQIMGEVFVDLDHIGLDLGPQAQRGAAVAKIVQRNAHALAAQHADGAAQAFDIGHALMLSQLDHQLAGADAQVFADEQPVLLQALRYGAGQGRGAHVQQQAAGQLEPAPLGHGQQGAVHFQLGVQAFSPTGGEQHIGIFERAADWATHQGLMAVDQAAVQLHDGLEDRAQLAAVHQAANRQWRSFITRSGACGDRGCGGGGECGAAHSAMVPSADDRAKKSRPHQHKGRISVSYCSAVRPRGGRVLARVLTRD